MDFIGLVSLQAKEHTPWLILEGRSLRGSSVQFVQQRLATIMFVFDGIL